MAVQMKHILFSILIGVALVGYIVKTELYQATFNTILKRIKIA